MHMWPMHKAARWLGGEGGDVGGSAVDGCAVDGWALWLTGATAGAAGS